MATAAPLRWREAMATALYGEGGFFVTGAPTGPGADGPVLSGPAAHFRTSVHAAPAFATAVLRLVGHVDEALGRPDPLDVVDVGAGRGELLEALARQAPAELARRLRLTAVELAPRPAGLVTDVRWRDTPPATVTGVLLAIEWLDNTPLDVVEVDADGVARYVLVDPVNGAEALGDMVAGDDAGWLARWWPLAGAPAGTRAEVGRSRDRAWSTATSIVERGLALCVDYSHTSDARPPFGTLTGFRAGRQVRPVPDGSCDLTAHVALDSVAAAGTDAAPGRAATVLLTQREALRALGVDGARPPLALASSDPAGYLRALAAASAAAELTDPAGLGGHHWLLQPVGADAQAVCAGGDVARCWHDRGRRDNAAG